MSCSLVPCCRSGTTGGTVRASACWAESRERLTVSRVRQRGVSADVHPSCSLDRVLVGSEEDKLPVIGFALGLDHNCDHVGGVFLAGVLLAVGEGQHDDILGAVSGGLGR